MGSIKHLLSFDLEEYFHGPAFGYIPSSQWDDLEPRFPVNMENLMRIIEGKRATFFILGWIAHKYPQIVKGLHAQGHEIACHSYMHKSIWDMSPQEFKADITSAKHALEDTIGAEVQGFRAPTFSITKDTYWAIDIIAETGFKYDSSIFPIHHDRYGIPDSPRLPYKIGDLWEIPMSTVRFFGANVPFGGGGYFRLYPYWLTNFFIKVAARNGNPFVFYQHPWELDASASTQPKSWVGWLRRNLVWGSTKEKLKKVVAQYEFQTIGDWVKAHENETGKIA